MPTSISYIHPVELAADKPLVQPEHERILHPIHDRCPDRSPPRSYTLEPLHLLSRQEFPRKNAATYATAAKPNVSRSLRQPRCCSMMSTMQQPAISMHITLPDLAAPSEVLRRAWSSRYFWSALTSDPFDRRHRIGQDRDLCDRTRLSAQCWQFRVHPRSS